MAVIPPDIGDDGATYAAKIDESLTTLDLRLQSVEGGGILLENLGDVSIPVETVDDQGNVISPGPVDNAAVLYDATSNMWYATDTPMNLDYLHQIFAPLGSGGSNVPIYVLQPGETEAPDTFPQGGLVIDPLATDAGEPTPGDFGFLAWTADPAMVTGTYLLPQSVLNVAWMPILGDWTVNQVGVYVTTAGVGTTISAIAIYDASGVRIKKAPSIVDESGTTTDFNSAGLKLGTFTTPYISSADEPIYVAVWSVGGTTAPTFLRSSGLVGPANIRLPASRTARYATGGAATTTTAPTNLGTLTNSSAMWAAIAGSESV